MSLIKHTKSWFVDGNDGFHCLRFDQESPVPKIGDCDVLVKFHAISLNYRDADILKGTYPFSTKQDLIPGSDGAGEVLAIGPKVTRFQKGDKVLTLFNQRHISGELNPKIRASGLGGMLDGTFREHGVFSEEGLVSMPSSLSWLEASTLTCAGLTAWNALYNLKPLLPGQVVLTQGTGGVSIFALQFAKAAGATVIATTSSARKAEILRKLGADHVINYNEVPDWGEMASSLTPKGEGVGHILEVGGPGTLAQSIKAIKIGGVISIIGFVAQNGQEPPSWLELLKGSFNARGIFVGSRAEFEDMNQAIEANKIKPVVDPKVFKLHELKEAYQYLWDRKHIGKVSVEVE